MSFIDEARSDLTRFDPDTENLPKSVRQSLAVPEEANPDEDLVANLTTRNGRSAVMTLVDQGSRANILLTQENPPRTWTFDASNGEKL